MKPFFKLCRLGLRHGAAAVFSLGLWTVWLLLALLLAGQIWWAGSRELAVPGFILRALEDRLAASQLQATFGKTSFDPSGRILVENVRLLSPSFNEPLVTVRAAYARLDPWALLAGRFEPLEIRVSGVSLFIPAMLSSSGRAEPLVSDLDAIIVPGEHDLDLRMLTTRLAGLVITARGSVHTAVWRHERGAPLPIADFIARDYPRLSRQLADYAGQLALLEDPRLDLDLSPSETRGAIVTATLHARGLKLAAPFAVQAVNLTAATRFPVAGETVVKAQLDVAADELRLPPDAVAEGFHARIRGTLRPEQFAFEPEQAEVSASRVTAQGLTAAPLAASASRPDGPLLVTMATEIAGATIAVSGAADPAQKSATLHVDTRPTTALLDALSGVAGRDLGGQLVFALPPRLSASVQLAPGWRFAALDARVATQGIVAHDVPFDDVSGRLTLAGTDFRATDIVLHQGENEARGSYTMDTATNDYRILLTGRLRPAGINGWFSDWWPKFFGSFDFTTAAPAADVDVQGRWGETRLTTVFISVNATSPVIRTVPFDQVRTRLFIRPDFYDALDFFATRGSGSARGTFTRQVDLEADAFRTMDFAVTSTMDVQEEARLFGPAGLDMVQPFHFAVPPLLRINGHLDGPAAAGGEHQKVHIEAESTGAFTLFDFPLGDLSFSANLEDNDLKLDRVGVSFGGGTGTGQVHLSGSDPGRRLDFNYELKGASLGQAIATLEDFSAGPGKTAAPARSAFLEKVADVRLDLALAASGLYHDPYSFKGSGHAVIGGAELGQIRLLGLLSELLNFTALRFTKLQADFQVDGRNLAFPRVVLTGANSQIDAKGSYALDQKVLDFNAKVYPLGESKFLLPQIFNVVLAPLSEILEVKLTGSLDQPQWAFVHGPTNLLRNLGPARTDEPGRPPVTQKPATDAPAAVSAPLQPDPKP
jgi:hypothetical protein